MTNYGLQWRPMVSALVLVFMFVPTETFKRVCYIRPDFILPVGLVVQLDLCTHLIVGFRSIDSSSRIYRDEQFLNFCQLCKQAIDKNGSETKLMFSIGDVVQQCNLDGVDIDWEFPSWGHNFSRRFERDNFVHLLKELRQEFNRYHAVTGKPLILSTAVAAQITIINVSYKPKEIAKHVDFINLMTYDFYIHKWYWPFIGHNSALHARPVDIGIANTFNTEWTANYWHLIGVPKRQIMVGIPTYGKRFTLYSKYLNYPGAVAVSNNADCTYSDVCDFLNLNDTIQKFDDQSKVPYAFNGYDWISYENELSVLLKAQWIKRNEFGGAMVFSLNADDFRYRCNEHTFPIHRTVRTVLTSP